MAATQALILLSVLALDSLPAFHPAALGASGCSQNASQIVAPSFKCFPDFVSMTRPTRSWLLPLLSSNHSPPTAPTPALHPSGLLQFPSLGCSLPTPGAFLFLLLPLPGPPLPASTLCLLNSPSASRTQIRQASEGSLPSTCASVSGLIPVTGSLSWEALPMFIGVSTCSVSLFCYMLALRKAEAELFLFPMSFLLFPVPDPLQGLP